MLRIVMALLFMSLVVNSAEIPTVVYKTGTPFAPVGAGAPAIDIGAQGIVPSSCDAAQLLAGHLDGADSLENIARAATIEIENGVKTWMAHPDAIAGLKELKCKEMRQSATLAKANAVGFLGNQAKADAAAVVKATELAKKSCDELTIKGLKQELKERGERVNNCFRGSFIEFSPDLTRSNEPMGINPVLLFTGAKDGSAAWVAIMNSKSSQFDRTKAVEAVQGERRTAENSKNCRRDVSQFLSQMRKLEISTPFAVKTVRRVVQDPQGNQLSETTTHLEYNHSGVNVPIRLGGISQRLATPTAALKDWRVNGKNWSLQRMLDYMPARKLARQRLTVEVDMGLNRHKLNMLNGDVYMNAGNYFDQRAAAMKEFAPDIAALLND